MLSLDHEFTPTLKVALSAGALYLIETEDTHFTGEATISKAFQNTLTSVSVIRGTSTGGGVFSEPAVTQEVSLRIARTLGDRVTVVLRGSFVETSSTGAPPGETSPTQSADIRTLAGRAAVTYAVTSWLNASAAFRYSTQHVSSELPAATGATDVRRRRVSVILTGTWEKQLQ
jgi:hypothetical protein